MTIKGLRKFLQKKVPQAFTSVPWNAFQETRIVIDTDNFMYQKMANALNDVLSNVDFRNYPRSQDYIDKAIIQWTHLILDFAVKLVHHGVTPVFIFDGTHLPEKDATKQKRREESKKRRERIAELVEKLDSEDPFDRSDRDVEELRKLKTQDIYFPPDSVETLKRVLSLVGFPVVTAYSDAEQLCCMMIREGHASGVFSQDSDCIAYGARFTLTGFTKGRPYYNPAFETVFFDPILPKLGMSYEKFRDFCIMCGCDYNTNIFRVGPVSAFDLLKKYQSIENLPEDYDTSVYKLDFCRPFFAPQKCEDLLDDRHGGILPPLMTNPESSEFRTILTNHKLGHLGTSYYHATRKIPDLEPFAPVKGYENVMITPTGFTIRFLESQDEEDRPFNVRENTLAVTTAVTKMAVNPIEEMIFFS